MNTSGINPTEFKVLILPVAVEEKTAGGIIKPASLSEAEQRSTTEGTLIAYSPLAFRYADDSEWEAAKGIKPKPGDRVVFARHAGMKRKGKDGKDYILCNDKDILATVEE